jgi:hypothetical protein
VSATYPRGVSGSSQFEDLEAAYAALRGALGTLVIERHRGADVAARERAYARERLAFEERLVAFEATGADPAALRSIRSTLGWMDELEAVEGLAEAGGEPLEPPDVAELRRRTIDAFADAGEHVRIGTDVVDRLTVLGRLATEEDRDRRRTIFEAMGPIWEAVDGDGGPTSPYRTLLPSSAARWARDGSPIEAAATALGMAPGSLEPTLRSILAAWREVLGPDLVEPWDYRYVTGAIERRIGSLAARERLQPINDAHLRSLGADPVALRIHYDVEPRPGRPIIPTAFTISEGVALQDDGGGWRAATPWVFATYAEGGIGNLEELLHESGHALHYAAIRARPAFFEPLVEDGGLVEGIADLIGWDAHEPAFQARHLGAAVDARESRLGRYGGVMLDICWALLEIELHRHPDRSPNAVWTELAEAGLGILPHPEWSWWAIRGQLLESPGYMANYSLSAIVAAALRARIREVRGDWLAEGGDTGWYPFVSEHVLRFGATRTSAEVLEAFLGRPLGADALLEDLAAATPGRGARLARCRR